MMIREGVAMHAFNGNCSFRPPGIPVRRGFSGHSSDGKPEAHQQPEQYRRQPELRAGVQINDSGAALGYYVSEDGILAGCRRNGHGYPVSYPAGRLVHSRF